MSPARIGRPHPPRRPTYAHIDTGPVSMSRGSAQGAGWRARDAHPEPKEGARSEDGPHGPKASTTDLGMRLRSLTVWPPRFSEVLSTSTNPRLETLQISGLDRVLEPDKISQRARTLRLDMNVEQVGRRSAQRHPPQHLLSPRAQLQLTGSAQLTGRINAIPDHQSITSAVARVDAMRITFRPVIC